ncbi:MAG TPA: DeoR/GlpR family DNA-binding transcription regulator [Chloroflexota bacterium]|nr:DeoR/GlpR family DNA-binding transcription regulator [Chloroflexota bacterium]
MTTRLFGEERRERILTTLSQHGALKAVVLSRRLGCSVATLRRDLQFLEDAGLLRRAHGGALRLESRQAEPEPSIREKVTVCAREKLAIGLVAARLVGPGDAVAFTGGTTTVQVARALRAMPHLRAVTNSIGVAAELVESPDAEITVTGGRLRGTLEMHGPLAEQSLRDLYVDVAFIGVDGLTQRHGLTTYNQLEASVNRLLIERARRVVVVADHTKIGRVTLALIAPSQGMHTLITDVAAPADELNTLREAGIEVILAIPDEE